MHSERRNGPGEARGLVRRIGGEEAHVMNAHRAAARIGSSALLDGAGCGVLSTTTYTSRVVTKHLDVLERQVALEQPSPSAKLTQVARRDECLDPDFDRREPEVWREYTSDVSAKSSSNAGTSPWLNAS